jgi:hypothetical protein
LGQVLKDARLLVEKLVEQEGTLRMSRRFSSSNEEFRISSIVNLMMQASNEQFKMTFLFFILRM